MKPDLKLTLPAEVAVATEAVEAAADSTEIITTKVPAGIVPNIKTALHRGSFFILIRTHGTRK